MTRRNVGFAVVAVGGLVGLFLLLERNEVGDNHSIKTPKPVPPNSRRVAALPAPPGEFILPAAADEKRKVTCVISGSVLQPDGLAAADAEITLTWRPSPRQAPVELDGEIDTTEIRDSLRSDSEGRFVTPGLLRGGVNIVAIHPTGVATERVELTSHRPMQAITIHLRGGLPIAGLVIDRDGSGIAGAQIFPLAMDGRSLRGATVAARMVDTDSTGTFRFDHLDVGSWTLLAKGPGYAPVITSPIAAGVQNARIVLSAGVELSCRVRWRDSGEPATGISVSLGHDDHHAAPLRSVSGADGYAKFSNVGAGTFLLDVDDEHYAPAGPPVKVSIDPARKPDLIELIVSAGGEIRGRVLDGNSNEGIPGIVVLAWQDIRDRCFFSSATTEDGVYTFGNLAPGSYTVGLPNRVPAYPQDPLYPQRKVITVSPGILAEGVDFHLKAGATLAGIVLDRHNDPVAGAAVRANAAEGRQKLAECFTGEDGRFRFGDFDNGERVVLVAETQSAQCVRTGPVVAGAPGSKEITLRLELDCTSLIAGRVIDRHNKPFACSVLALAEDESLKFPAIVPDGRTDANGYFVLSGMCAGIYKLELVPRSNARQTCRAVTVGASTRVTGLTLIYDQGELLELSGIVVDLNGRPVSDAYVRTSFVDGQVQYPGSGRRTDENGLYLFEGLPEGAYELSADAPGFSGSMNVLAHAGDSGVVVQLLPAPSVNGVVENAQRLPVLAYTLSFIPQGLPETSIIRHNISSESGNFSVDLPQSGLWQLRVESAGYVPHTADLGHVTLDDEITLVVELERPP